MCELWKEYEYTFLSYYFSAKGLKDHSKEDLINYLEKNGIKNLSDSDNFTVGDISFNKKLDNNNYFWVMTISMGD